MTGTTSWNPDSYSKSARFVSELGEPLLILLDPKPAETILDLGCGGGALTEKIKTAGSPSSASIRAVRSSKLHMHEDSM